MLVAGGTPMKPAFQLTVRISEALAERIKIRAVREKLTLQELTARALEAYLRTPLQKEDAR
jgi:predicted DNA binding CopG/RHH family protein